MSRAGKALVGTIAGLVILALLVGGFVWNEARKEVVYLCGNFTAGVKEASVLQQLETGHFLSYHREPAVMGSRLVVSSPYDFDRTRCVIEVDGQGTVRVARLERPDGG